MIRFIKILHKASLVFLFSFIFSFLMVNLAALSQSGGWSTPQPLSPETRSNWFPDVAADAAGNVHVAWSGGVSAGVGSAYDVVYYTTSRDGQTWTEPKDIVALPSKGAVTRPSLLATTDGVLHLTFRDYTIYYSQASIGSVQPNQMLPKRIISTIENGYFSFLTNDSQNQLHVVYTDNTHSPSCPACFHVFHRLSQDGGLSWTPGVDITPVVNGAGKPKLVIKDDDSLHVVWEAGLGGDLGQIPDPTTVRYSRSTDLGMTWSDFYEFPAPGGRARNPTLGLDGQGQLVAAYLGLPEDVVYYQVSRDNGNSWSDPQAIPGMLGAWSLYQGRTDGYAMASDSRGDVHLVLVGRIDEGQITPQPTAEPASGEVLTQTATLETAATPRATPTPAANALSVLHLTWDGSRWSQPEAIFTVSGDVPEWPRIAVGLGNRLHVVWFVRDEAHIWGPEGATRYRIWYAQKEIDAPALTPVSAFPTQELSQVSETPTAYVAIPPSAIETATPTVLPVVSPDIPRELVYSEQGYLRVIAFSLAPVLALLGLTIVVFKVRNQK